MSPAAPGARSFDDRGGQARAELGRSWLQSDQAAADNHRDHAGYRRWRVLLGARPTYNNETALAEMPYVSLEAALAAVLEFLHLVFKVE
jgi:hypothetical protein